MSFVSVFQRTLFLFGLVILLANLGCGSETMTEEQVEPEPAITTVSLVIRQSIDPEKKSGSPEGQSFAVPWKTDATAFSVLFDAGVETQSTGSGETRFVTSTDDLNNEGSGGANWIFSVNGKTGSKSCDATKVFPGDKVEWNYGDYVME